ncbi:unnamed protein product [Symbiodinium necroappetens]|uniref:PEP-CTERM protein-sorting domain-containing protein n=1 Tax=Symbiodinium necroappetens TaxID=1628268 RepID=A0A812ISL6_9DINO|nr:unnamed protein product [Symbiodinium necroappetens]
MTSMTSLSVRAGFAALLLAAPASAQSLLNGSLEGPVAVGSAPPDWFEWQKTPDTCDAAGPFNNTGTPWVLSPDGGTFVRGGGSDFANSEAIGQVVTGFSTGDTYAVNFFQTNLGFQHPTSGDWLGEDGFWELVIDGAVVGASDVLSRPATPSDSIVWSVDTLSFTATSASHEIALVSRSTFPGGLAAYMGIDGVRLSLVPTPGSAALMALGGVAAIRRRRA